MLICFTEWFKNNVAKSDSIEIRKGKFRTAVPKYYVIAFGDLQTCIAGSEKIRS